MKRLILPLLCLLSPVARAGGETCHILPAPQSVEYTTGQLILPFTPTVVYPVQLTREAQLLAGFLQKDFYTECCLVQNRQKADIILEIDTTTLPDKTEGYVIDATGKEIYIRANSPTGILHGIQSLRQILKVNDGRLTLQKTTVTDWPVFTWRAYMLDEGRHFMGKDVVKRLLDRMSELKMNTFHWHLTDDQGWRIEIKKYPRLTEVGAFRDSTEIGHFESNVFDGKPHGGFYTQDDIREIVAYAAKLHINIVPEVEMPGHASAAIAAYPWLGTSGKEIQVPCKFGVQYNVFNIASPRVIQFFEDVLDEVLALFPSPVVHIGGDEVRYNHWKASPEMRQYMQTHNLENPAALQVFFTNYISNRLALKGRRMMGWNEITGAQINHYQQGEAGKQNQTLAPGTVVQFWKGSPELIRETIAKGYDVVNSNNIYTYIDYTYEDIPLETAYRFNPVPEGLTTEQARRIIGLGCQMWCEFVPDEKTLESKTYPRIAAYADTGWRGTKCKDYTRFLHSLQYFVRHWEDLRITVDKVNIK